MISASFIKDIFFPYKADLTYKDNHMQSSRSDQ